MLCLTDFQNENLNVRLLKPGKIMGGENISLCPHGKYLSITNIWNEIKQA
jgi:hypothetical protein